MVMPLAEYFSADQVRALPDDGKRYEVVHGELLVTPAPGGSHQFVLTRLVVALYAYLAAHNIEEVLVSPADISFGPDTLVQPDLFVADLRAYRLSLAWSDIRTLHLAIEIVSPSSARADRFTKRRLYQEQRIPDYWVVDTERRHIEVWTPNAIAPRIESVQLTWRHPEVDAACSIDLPKLFDVRG